MFRGAMEFFDLLKLNKKVVPDTLCVSRNEFGTTLLDILTFDTYPHFPSTPDPEKNTLDTQS